MHRWSSGTHVTVEKVSMQGWGRGTHQPSKKHVVEKKVNVAAAGKDHQNCALREYRITLEKDVAKLQKKLKQEVDTHKALERAFRRTLGVLPRFSPYLSPKIQELLAEVALLEEEVLNLEECIVSLRQGLYNEAVYLSSSKQHKSDSEPFLTKDFMCPKVPLQNHHLHSGAKGKRNSVIAKLLPPVLENKPEESYASTGRFHNSDPRKLANDGGFFFENFSSQMKHVYALQAGSGPFSSGEVATPRINMSGQNKIMEDEKLEKENQQKMGVNPIKLWSNSSNTVNSENTKRFASGLASQPLDLGDSWEPNSLSEEMVWCLSSIFLKLAKSCSLSDCDTLSIVSHSTLSSVWSFSSRNNFSYKQSMDITDKMQFPDPYRICTEVAAWDIGPYRYYYDITADSLDYSRIPSSASFLRKLMGLLEKLSMVDLRGLTHQQKLAFWINIYNVCMLHAFLEHGIPTSPQKVVALMGKAVLNVGGHLLSALAIEHFILRLPSDLENNDWKNREKETEGKMRSTYGLEWPEPLVSFALCCGSWSSPAVRIYTPLEIENELEIAKNEFLQAAVGVTPKKVLIPKLLDWYRRDFAKDAESLMDWVAEQLPSSLCKSVQKCLANSQGRGVSEVVEVMPYDFNFRYLFAVHPL